MNEKKGNISGLVWALIAAGFVVAATIAIIVAYSYARTAWREIARTEAQSRRAELKSNLQTIQSHLSLYRTEHRRQFPGITADGTFDGELFARQMTNPTDGNGKVMDPETTEGAGEEYPFGPYLDEIPENPMVDTEVARRVTGGPNPPPRDGSSAWWLDTGTGDLSANHTKPKPAP
ncbi:MAG: hypothetical protein ACLFVU_08180 [Phycisphaerae bacterium]